MLYAATETLKLEGLPIRIPKPMADEKIGSLERIRSMAGTDNSSKKYRDFPCTHVKGGEQGSILPVSHYGILIFPRLTHPHVHL